MDSVRAEDPDRGPEQPRSGFGWAALLRERPPGWRSRRPPLDQETDPGSRARLEDLRGEVDAKHAQWAEQAERDYDLKRAAQLRYGTISELERRLDAEEEQLANAQGRTVDSATLSSP